MQFNCKDGNSKFLFLIKHIQHQKNFFSIRKTESLYASSKRNSVIFNIMM